MLTMTKLESSNVGAVAYFADQQLLLVQYHDGSMYARLNVAPAEHEALMAAESKGRFLAGMKHATVLLEAPLRDRPPVVELSRADIEKVRRRAPDVNCDFTIL